jgi:hypothetical protein
MSDIGSLLDAIAFHLGCVFCFGVVIHLLNSEGRRAEEYASMDHKYIDDILKCASVSFFAGSGLLCLSGMGSWWYSKNFSFFPFYKMGVFLIGLFFALISLGCFFIPVIDGNRIGLVVLPVMIICCISGVLAFPLIIHSFQF